MTRIAVLTLSTLAGIAVAEVASNSALCKLNPDARISPSWSILCAGAISERCKQASDQVHCCNNDGLESKKNPMCVYSGAKEQSVGADAGSEQLVGKLEAHPQQSTDQTTQSKIDARFELAARLEELDNAHKECKYPVNKPAPQQADCPTGYNCMRYIGPKPTGETIPDYCYLACESPNDCPENQYCDDTWKVCY